MIVLDTDVLSEPMRLRPDARVLAWLTGLEEESAVTAVTVGELLTGIRTLPEGRRRDGLLGSASTGGDGGGHGGIAQTGTTVFGAPGGSGVVILRYALPSLA